MRASEAIAAGRQFAPAGSSAAELLLELRDRGRAAPGDEAALVELQPYLVIAAEQAVEGLRVDEARRLVDLLARMDPVAPALPRLRTALATVRAVPEAPAPARPVGPVPALPAAVAARSPAAGAAAPDAPVASARPTAQSTATAPAAVAGAPPASASTLAAAGPVPAAAPSPAVRLAQSQAVEAAPEPVRAVPALRLVQDAAPRYPARAQPRRLDGRVELMFTVQPDGSVSDLRVVEAQPAGIFDQAALQAARRWRFAPIAAATTTSRALRFTPPPG